MKLTINTQNIFFASDWHLFHNSVIKPEFDDRPFDNIHQMHDELVENWNSVVTNDDYVFYTGDLSFGSRNKTLPIIKELNGKIHFVMGNHDKYKDIKKLDKFVDIVDYYDLTVLDDTVTEGKHPGKQLICMMHYPIISWNCKGYGSWMVHGHCHGKLMKSQPEIYEQKIIDVGCMNHNYIPISYEELRNEMNTRIIKTFD